MEQTHSENLQLRRLVADAISFLFALLTKYLTSS
jgi:hypothetical protein